jgi:hypothetical protein
MPAHVTLRTPAMANLQFSKLENWRMLQPLKAMMQQHKMMNMVFFFMMIMK